MTHRIPMSRLARAFLLPFFGWITLLTPTVWGQSASTQFTPTRETTGNISVRRTPKLLFEEVQGYAKKKNEELGQLKPDDPIVSKIRREQKELAAEYVDALQARGPQTGEDLYYFGRLQFLAGNEDAALGSLRLFLATAPDGEIAQLARPVAISCALRKKLISEAEQTAADYERNESQRVSAI